MKGSLIPETSAHFNQLFETSSNPRMTARASKQTKQNIIKATEQYFPVVLFIMLYKVVLTFESVDEILWCDHSNESY